MPARSQTVPWRLQSNKADGAEGRSNPIEAWEESPLLAHFVSSPQRSGTSAVRENLTFGCQGQYRHLLRNQDPKRSLGPGQKAAACRPLGPHPQRPRAPHDRNVLSSPWLMDCLYPNSTQDRGNIHTAACRNSRELPRLHRRQRHPRLRPRHGPLAACRSAIACEHDQAHSATLNLNLPGCGRHMQRFHHTLSALQAVAARGITHFS
jgi:hypothetical protein